MKYSVTEARNCFSAILHEIEVIPAVEITRHGVPIAILVSWQVYQELKTGRNFWAAYNKFRERYDLANLAIEPEGFAGTRDQTSGCDVDFGL